MDDFDVKQKTEAQSHYLSRLQKLKAHHSVCESRYEKTQTKILNDERERTLFFHHNLNTALTKEMLGHHTDSISTIASSEEEFVPASSEASSDESSERRPNTGSKKRGKEAAGSSSLECRAVPNTIFWAPELR
ncbi:hypothetical protein N1851_027392 [Merluccius polli]|uniref:Uncharacterized protein n=1 Tax=Merluccius polli TaxID=89951 RepID=A0AA47MAB2_MERPO|nr:hypothetical protein N1851_027392 [Merluccius polli]